MVNEQLTLPSSNRPLFFVGGMLVIFPSWLPHEVYPMPEYPEYEGPRIAISFNVMYKYG